MRLAVVIVLVLMLAAARFELSIRSGPVAQARTAPGNSFAIDLRMGGMLSALMK